MIRAIDSKRVDLSDNEYEYYMQLVETFGKDDFRGLFTSDKNGQITSITPPLKKEISLGVMFFILNVMMNQRLRALASVVQKNKNNVDENLLGTNLEGRLEKIEAHLGISENGDNSE